MTTEAGAVTYDLFISYCEGDRPWVDGFLLDALDAAEVRYHTEDAFALGVPRLVEFERAIKGSARTLLVLSPAYLADTFGQFVDVLVNSYGMETATWPVVPLILQTVTMPARLSQLVALKFSDPERQQAELAKLFEQLQRPVPGLRQLPACPYPGMVPFDEADSARFFGREPEVQDLQERLRLHPFLAVIGASGSGKSSLVRAGLIPALRKSRAFGAGEWAVRIIRPGAAPLATLDQALADIPRAPAAPAADSATAGAEPAPAAPAEPATNGAAPAEISTDGAAPAPAEPADLALAPGTRLLLVVDQFEECFTLAESAVAFQSALLRLSQTAGCYVVLTARADFYADLMTSPLWPEIQAHRVEITPLNEAGLRRAILQPAEQVDVAIEGTLVERLADDAAGEPGVLPLVQETLVLLWERLERRFLPLRAYEALVLTRASYGALGDGELSGLQVAIARRADTTFASLAAEQQPIARRIFLRLVQFGEGRADTRRQQPLDALRSAADDPAQFDITIKQLTDSRLLTLSAAVAGAERPSARITSPASVQTRVDISHEALIRGWPTLQSWLDERRAGEQIRRRLEAKTAEWVRLGSGNSGLLDEVEVQEAERWLESVDALEMGFDTALPELVIFSRAAIEQAAADQEAARQRELAQAQALAATQTKLAEEAAAREAAAQELAAAQSKLANEAIEREAAAQELASTQTKLAEEAAARARSEAQAAERLRQRALLLAGALGLALLLAITAFAFQRQAATQAQVARSNAAEAQAQRGTAEASAAEAQRQRDLAVRGELLARAGETVAQSNLAGDSLQRGLLLAVEAANLSRRAGAPDAPSAAQAIRAHLNAIGGRQLLGAQDSVSVIAYSADGRYLAAGGGDGALHVLDMRAADPAASPALLRGHEGKLAALAFSPDGRYLASAGLDATVQLWDMRGGPAAAEALVLIGGTSTVTRLAFSSDGRYFAAGSDDGNLRLWDLRAADPAASLLAAGVDTGGHPIRTLAFSPDGRRLAAGDGNALLRLWDMRAADLSASVAQLPLPEAQGEVSTLAFSPDGRYLATGSGFLSYTVSLWDLSADPASLAASRADLSGHTLAISGLAFTPDSRTLVSASRDATVRRWDVAGRAAVLPVLRGHVDEVRALALSSDGRYLFTGGRDRVIRRWDLASPDPNGAAETLRGHDNTVLGLVLSPDGRTLTSFSDDSSVRLWDLTAEDLAAGTTAFKSGRTRIEALAYSADGRYLATGSDDGIARVWDLRAGAAQPRELGGHTGFVNALAFSPRASLLASASDAKAVQLWDLDAPGAPARQLPGSPQGTLALAFSADGRYLAGGGQESQNSQIWLWDLDQLDAAPRTLDSRRGAIYAVAFSPDGRTLAAGSFDGAVLLWDLGDAAARPRVLAQAGGAASAVAFSPDGHYVAAASYDKSVRLWDMRAADPAASALALDGHRDAVTALAFSPDSQSLVTVGYDRSVRLWSLAASPPTAALFGSYRSALTAVRFSPDGRTLATADSDANVVLTALDLDRLLKQACAAAGRNLSLAEWSQAFGDQPYQSTCADWRPHPSYLNALASDAAKLVGSGNLAQALAAFGEIRRLDPQYVIDAGRWAALCRAGVLAGQVKDVLEACGQAVALAPANGAYNDSRAVARALTGDTAGAADDLQIVIGWAAARGGLSREIADRERWLAELKAGRSPFDAATLASWGESALAR